MFTTSSKGKPILVHDGYEFFKKREGRTTTTWNCSKYQKFKCRATATTANGEVLEVKGEHFHGTDLGKPEARKIIADIKQSSEQVTPALSA